MVFAHKMCVLLLCSLFVRQSCSPEATSIIIITITADLNYNDVKGGGQETIVRLLALGLGLGLRA